LKSFIKLAFKTVITIAVLLLLAYFGWKYALPRLDEKVSRQRESTVVKKVFDGDTFEADVNGKTEKIRMLGIDTPEKSESDKLDREVERTQSDKKTIQTLGELAYKYTLNLIGGKKITLTSEPGGDDRDRYGRLLRYVWLEDGTFVNKKIVEDGYANAYRRYNLTRQNELVEAEKLARENKKGLWGDVDGLKYFDGRDK
jgi:micrococcal nuclease